jgi:hypothetical protein
MGNLSDAARYNEGLVADAIDIIRSAWGEMLAKGATTCWEIFPGMVGSHLSRSLCHGWSTMPAYLCSTYLFGVTVLEPGYKRIRVQPHPCQLTYASGKIPTPLGTLSIAWQRDPHGEIRVTVDAPAGCIVEMGSYDE